MSSLNACARLGENRALAVALALGVLVAVACDDSSGPEIDRSISSVELSQTTAGIVPEAELALRAVVRDTSGEEVDRLVSWTSSDPVVAIVSTDGVVKGIAPGTAVITATAGGRSAMATIDVSRVSFTSLSVGNFTACGLTDVGTVYCWGQNQHGGLGDGTTEWRLAPVRVRSELTFRAVSVGWEHFCAIASDGSGHCWGANFVGALGDGSLEPSLSPVPVSGGLQFEAISAGKDYTCGLTPADAAYCWGDNTAGQLGDGSQQDSPVPVRVQGDLKLRSIRAGGGGGSAWGGQRYSHTCAVDVDDRGYCWGANWLGAIGTGAAGGINTEPFALPETLRFAVIEASFEYSCGITIGNDLLCWGRNDWGQLGRGFDSWREPTIEAVNGGLQAVSISGTYQTTCAVSDGAVGYCWGWGGWGQLGHGTAESRYEPTVLPGSLAFTQVAAGTHSGCGLTVDGIAYCWGYYLALGVGFNYFEVNGTPYAEPVPVLGQVLP